jgi:hypothetical protein
MRVLRSTIVALLLVCTTHITHGQGFENIFTDLGILVFNENPNWGAGVSFYDFDKDGWSDLSFAVKGDSIKLFRNTGDGFEIFPSPLFNPGDSKQLTWVDYDNDGDADLLNTTYAGYTHLLRNEGDFVFVDVSNIAGIPQNTSALTYGASWGDYDKDGWLDVYICNYNWPSGITNWLLHNNQDGTFTEVAASLGVSNGSNPTFQSVWLDYNGDTWPDLYVINDKLPLNALYKNDGDGTFTNVSGTSGTNLSMDAMTNSVCDYDNDGDLDIYITNEPSGNALLRNNGMGVFVNVAGQANVSINALTWGSLWIDFDNDMWDDLFVASTHLPTNAENYFFVNNSGSFVAANWLGFSNDFANSYSVAKADYDRDGYSDFIVYNDGFSLPHFYHNLGGSNHSISVGLEGTVSNRDGIGTWIHSYIGGTKYVEYTMCGENYMGQDSQYETIPMDDHLVVDSLVLLWPSGIIDRHYNIPAGAFLSLVEGYAPSPAIEITGPNSICGGMNTELSTELGFDSYLWSTGDTTAMITVTEPGNYSVTITHSGGVPVPSSLVTVSAITPAVLSSSISNVTCYGDSSGAISIFIETGALDSILWSTGEQSLFLESLSAGDYGFEAWDTSGCLIADILSISQPDSLSIALAIEEPLCANTQDGLVEVMISGGSPGFQVTSSADDLSAIGIGSYLLTVTDTLGCISTMEFTVEGPEAIIAEFDITHSTGNDGAITSTVSGGSGSLDLLWSNSVTGPSLDNLVPGIYTLTVSDDSSCVQTFDVEILLVEAIDELNTAKIVLFPQPASSEVFILNLPESTRTVYHIRDVKGTAVMTGILESNSKGIRGLSSLAAGMYFLHLISDEHQVAVARLMIH